MRDPDKRAAREPADRKISYRILSLWSDLLLCSRCLKGGVQRPVGQVISKRHRLRSLCSSCQGRREASVLLQFP